MGSATQSLLQVRVGSLVCDGNHCRFLVESAAGLLHARKKGVGGAR